MTFRRRRSQRTDFKQRLALLKSGRPRMIVRRGINGFRVQVVEYTDTGDRVLLEVTSKYLKKYGWNGHGGSIPSAYLTGIMAGLMARKKNIKSLIVDIGLQKSLRGSSIYAVAAGAKEAGVDIPIGSVSPPKDRLSGAHVAKYAALLKKSSHDQYKKQFASYLKNSLDPEKLPEHVEEIKKKLFNEFGMKKAVATTGETIDEMDDEGEWEDKE